LPSVTEDKVYSRQDKVYSRHHKPYNFEKEVPELVGTSNILAMVERKIS